MTWSRNGTMQSGDEMRAKEFVAEALSEILDKPVQYDQDNDLIKSVNDQNKDRGFSGHTNVMATQKMKDADTFVVRFMDGNRDIQYHIVNLSMESGTKKPKDQVDRRVRLEALNIIFHDSRFYLAKHIPVVIIAPSHEHRELYERLAKSMIDRIDPDLRITDLGVVHGEDGGSGPAFKISEQKYLKNNGFGIADQIEATAPSVYENCSVGGTSSGAVATVSMPLGGTVRRDGGTLLGGYQSSDEFPNTPDYIKKQAAKWKSSNKNN